MTRLSEPAFAPSARALAPPLLSGLPPTLTIPTPLRSSMRLRMPLRARHSAPSPFFLSSRLHLKSLSIPWPLSSLLRGIRLHPLSVVCLFPPLVPLPPVLKPWIPCPLSFFWIPRSRSVKGLAHQTRCTPSFLRTASDLISHAPAPPPTLFPRLSSRLAVSSIWAAS